jgi:uncharacterized membrane protein YadS
MNRLRERVSLLIFAGLMNPKSVELTSAVNDIICGVDAIAVFNPVKEDMNEVSIAINFTEDFSRIYEKIKRTR